MSVDARSGAILERLLALHPKRIDLVLDRIERLLGQLGHPERKLPPVIHVAGTNGKGSVCAFSRAILEAQGLRVHVYTSPHLVHYHERIRLAGTLISEGELSATLAECERVNDGVPITFFEITTAAALLAFSRHPADALVLEVGLGGKYDATNVVARPRMTVITPVGLDHQEFLGNSIADIAAEKAGIIKPGVPVIVGPQEDIPGDVIVRRADALSAPLYAFGQDFFAHQEHGRLVYQDTEALLDLPMPRLVGRHQIENAAIAIAALRRAGGGWGQDDAIERGLVTVEWPARLQRLTHGPMIDAGAERRRSLVGRRTQSAWRRGRRACDGRFRGKIREAPLSHLRHAEDERCRGLSVVVQGARAARHDGAHRRRGGEPRSRRPIRCRARKRDSMPARPTTWKTQ